MVTNAFVDRAETDDLAARVRGEVLQPGDPGYETARRVWNGVIEKWPAVIVRARDAEDVRAAVTFARDTGTPLAVRGGGHNVAGHALVDEGLVIDLSGMRGVSVDPQTQRVKVQGGATIGDMDAATQRFGLAVPAGVVTETGIAGLALGGGLGWLRRKFGLTADNIVSATVVLADGQIVTANEDEHPELFWAIRGGGGNFGVVTEFEFQAYRVGPEIPFVLVFHPFDVAAEALRFFREYAAEAPDDVSAFAILGEVPHADDFPEEVRGKNSIIFAAAWSGDPGESERWLRPLREFAEPLGDISGVTPFLDVQRIFDEDYPSGGRYYWKSNYLSELDDGTIAKLVDLAARRPSGASTLDIWQLGGAMARVAPDATPVPQRDAPFLLGIEANWTAPADDAANIAWAREVYDATLDAAHGLYVNFPGFGEEGQDLVRAAYGRNYERLATVKTAYDPDNLFAHNQNIRPQA